MKTKNILIAGLAIVIMVAVYVWFFVYNKAHTDYQKIDAAYIGNAVDFYKESTSDATVFSEKYLNQAVEISGSISSLESSSTVIISPGIICQADSTSSFDGLTQNQNITLRGRAVGTDEDLLTGELMLRLDNCVLK